MSLRVAWVFAAGVLTGGWLIGGWLIGGCASQSSLMDVRHMTDERLISYYHETEAEIAAVQKKLDDSASSGRVITSAVRQDNLNALLKRKYKIQGEFIRRELPVPTTPPAAADTP